MKWLGVFALGSLQFGSAFLMNRSLACNSSRKLCVVATVYVSQIHSQGVRDAGKIEVVHSDLTTENVDAIVNAANSQLQHGGGIAGAIVRRGGVSIQQESDDYVAEHGTVPVGGTAVTGQGNLPCKYIIHAVGPVWHGGHHGEEEALQTAVVNSLNECHERRLKSVAIPAISSGIFGFPKELCAKILFTAAIDFLRSRDNTTLTCIRFTNIDQPTVDVFKRYAETLYNKPGLKVELAAEKSKL